MRKGRVLVILWGMILQEPAVATMLSAKGSWSFSVNQFPFHLSLGNHRFLNVDGETFAVLWQRKAKGRVAIL